MENVDHGSKDLKQSVVEWLCEEGHHIAIADYQRSYAWSESHVTAFVETLLDALADEERGAGTRAPDIGVIPAFSSFFIRKISRASFTPAEPEERSATCSPGVPRSRRYLRKKDWLCFLP